MPGYRSQRIKGIVLLLAAVIALAIAIHKGGESIFFGCVIALVCGLVGVLFIKGDGAAKKPKRARRR